jgi:hypothetical protein
VSSRRDRKESLRREREDRERQARAARQRKRLAGYGVAGAIALATVVVVAVLLAAGGGDGAGEPSSDVLPEGGEVPDQKVFDVQQAARAAGCELKAVKGSGSQEHTQDPNERIPYNSNPPTTGRHFITPAEDGAYGEAPTDEALVHGLEHGRVIVWFKPGLPKDARANLRALFEEDTYQMFLVPRRNMPYEVAASAWNAEPAPNGTGRLLLCDKFGQEAFDAIRAFRDEHRSNGPEPVP